VVILDAGRTVAEGTPEALWTRPPTAWAARFLGFRNVAPGRLGDRVIETPWGRLPTEGVDVRASSRDVTVILRSGGLVLSEGGPISGVVAARRFRGDHVQLDIEVAGAPILHMEARDDALPAVGAAVSLRLAPGALHVIDEATALPSGA
jgi:thiamine transport system ATP-binding protein